MYYRILSKDVPVEVINTGTNDLIQISDKALRGFSLVIEDAIPEDREGYYIASNYEIIDGEVHKTYHYEEIVESEENIEA